MNLLAVDIGNTSTALGSFTDAAIVERFRFLTRTLTHRALTKESLVSPLAEFPSPEYIGIASVVPWASDELIVVLHDLYPSATILVITSSNLPLTIDYPKPDELGTDRLLGALAAFRQWGQPEKRPCIVIDLGTATTYDCITAEGVYLGGAIAPGIELSSDALTQKAAQLPPIDLTFPSSIIGRTTVESIQSGVLFGALTQIEGMVRRFSEVAFPNQRPVVVATGGFSGLFRQRTPVISHFAPELVLDGIRISVELLAEQAPASGRDAAVQPVASGELWKGGW